MFLQAGGGGKGIRPIQQSQQQPQQTAQQQSQQHQNQIPSHHHQSQPPLLASSSSAHSLQAHHQPSQTNTPQQLHHGQQPQQQQSSGHLASIQQSLLPQPSHPQAQLQHPSHHHAAIPYYTYQLSQAPQPPPPRTNHQQQVPNNGGAAAPLVLSPPNQPSNGNGTSSAANNGGNNGNNTTILRQHPATGNGTIPTLYATNTALLQSPTATPGFMTPYMQQYPLQTAVIAAATAAQYQTNPGANGNNGSNGGNHNNQTGSGPPPPMYQLAQQSPQQQQAIMQYFHPAGAGVPTGPTPTAPPHLHPSQPQYRGVLTSGHTQRHNAPATYLLPAGPTTLYAMPSGPLTTGPPQRTSLLTAPGQQGAPPGNANMPNMQMSQLIQATTPTGATTFMPAAFCAAPMGMGPGALAGASPMLAAGAPLGPSPLQTYSHLANVSMSSSNTSMSSLGEGNTKPRPHAIPIIHPITHENILDPKPLQKSASVEVKPSAVEFGDTCSPSASAGCIVIGPGDSDSKSSSTSVASNQKSQDKSVTVSLPQTKPTLTPSDSTTSTCSSLSRDKMDQQMQTEKLGKMKIEVSHCDKKSDNKNNNGREKYKSEQKFDNTNRHGEIKAPSYTKDHGDHHVKETGEDEQLVVVMDEQKTYVYTPTRTLNEDDGANTGELDEQNVKTTFHESHGDCESKKVYDEPTSAREMADEANELPKITTALTKTTKIIHDKGQQAFIPRRSNEQPQIQIAKRDDNLGPRSIKIPYTADYQRHDSQSSSASPTKTLTIKSKTPMAAAQQAAMTMTATISPTGGATVSQIVSGSTTTLVPSNPTTPIKNSNSRRRNNKNASGTATSNSSCSSVSSCSGTLNENVYPTATLIPNSTKSSTTLVPNMQDAPQSFVKPPTLIGNVNNNNVNNNIAITTSAWMAKPFQQQQLQQQPQIHKRQQQQQIQQQQHQQLQQSLQQQSSRNTPATSGASSSTASTPTHQSQQASTDTSATPTSSAKRTRNKRAKAQKKKNENVNRNQNALSGQTTQQQQLPQKQHSNSSVRGSNSSIYNNGSNNNNNNNNNSSSNNNSSCSSNSNLNYNQNSRNKKGGMQFQANANNTSTTATTTATAVSPTISYVAIENTLSNQTDNNSANSYNSAISCTNNSNNNNNLRKNSLTSSYKGGATQHQHQQYQQQLPQQQRYFSNNNNNSNRSSHCSLTFGGMSSDAGSVSEAESKASLTAYSSDIVLPDLKCNFSSENTTPSSSRLTSPKTNRRHMRAREIVAQYLTPLNTTDSGSDKTGSDEPSLQFLNSSSSACEDDDDSNARLQFRKQQIKFEKHQQLDPYQQPLEFGLGAMALSEVDEVYFGDFTDEKDLVDSTKTDDDLELNVTITKIYESQKSKQKIADTIDCVPLQTLLAPKESNEKKITILKSSDKDDYESKQRDFAAAMKPIVQTTTIMPTAATTTTTITAIPTSTTTTTTQSTRTKFFRYSLRDLKELANAPESCKPPMVVCQKGDCVSQLFVSRQQHHIPTHQTHASLSALAMQHLQQYQQINFNESIEFVTGKRRSTATGVDRLKKHDHIVAGMPMGAGGNLGMMGLMAGAAGASSSSQQQRKMDIIRVHLSLKEEIKLSECDNAWMPDTLIGKAPQRPAATASPNDDLESVLKKVRGVLNKLTPNNFDVLKKTMTSISMNTQEKMQQVMLLIFEKTVSEPNFAPTYAKFCKELFQEIKAESKSLFSNLLITRIQHEFETNVNDADAKQVKLQPLVDKLASCSDPKERMEVKAELEDQEYQFRRRAWGTVRFIGEMYKLQSLRSDRVLHCIESLLEHGSEEKLEFMCKLLTTVGYLLEMSFVEQASYKTRIDNIFRRIQEIVQSSRSGGGSSKGGQAQQQTKISSRVRFMMQDVMDLRARHWDQQPRASSSGSTASTTQPQQPQQAQQQGHQQRRKDEKLHNIGGGGGGGSTSAGSNLHDKQSGRSTYGSSGVGNQGTHRQMRCSGNMAQGENNHYFMQKMGKHYMQQHHQQQEQKVNIDVNKLKFTRGDEVTPSTTKLGSSTLYLWRTAGRQMSSASTSSLTTSASATSATSSRQLSLSTQSSNTSSVAGNNNSNSFRRQTSNPFEVLDRVSPTTPLPANSSDGDDAFTDETDDNSNTSIASYSDKECQQLINRLVEEMFDVTAGDTSWQKEALNIWCKASMKQQVSLLHYLLMVYLHLAPIKRPQREACAKIFKHLLVTPEIFDRTVFNEAYAQFGEEFPDLLVDVPNGWLYVFEFLGPIIHADLLGIEDIWLSQWSEDTCFVEKFLKAFINYFTNEYGVSYMQDLWHDRYKLDNGQHFALDEENWQRFVLNNHYEYLLEAPVKLIECSELHGHTEIECLRRAGTKRITIDDSESGRDPAKHVERISSLLRLKNGTDLCMEYIIGNVHINNDFLRGITELFCCEIATSGVALLTPATGTASTTVTTPAPTTLSGDKKERLKGNKTTTQQEQQQQQQRRFEMDLFRKKCLPILRLCVDSNEQLELSCLDAFYEILLDNYEEAAANKVICNIFDLFYDSELIPKDTFEKWYQTQALVDDAIEAAGAANVQEMQTEIATKTTNNNKTSTNPKKNGKSQAAVATTISNDLTTDDNNSSSNSNSSSSSSSTHKIGDELHAFMRKLLFKNVY